MQLFVFDMCKPSVDHLHLYKFLICMSVFFYLKICFKKDAFRQIQDCDVGVAMVTYISDTA